MPRSYAPAPTPVSQKSRAIRHVSAQIARRPARPISSAWLNRLASAPTFAYITATRAMVVSAAIRPIVRPLFVVRDEVTQTNAVKPTARPMRPDRDNDPSSAPIIRQADAASQTSVASRVAARSIGPASACAFDRYLMQA